MFFVLPVKGGHRLLGRWYLFIRGRDRNISGGGHFLLEVKSVKKINFPQQNQPKLPSTSFFLFFFSAENVDFIDG